MENTPRKSKALIITIVVVLLLLIGGYLFYTKPVAVFGTKSSSSTGGSIFAPLFGTSKQKDVATIDKTSKDGSPLVVTTDKDGKPIEGNAQTGSFGGTTGNGAGSFGTEDGSPSSTNGSFGYGDGGVLPTFNPVPTPGFNPSDGTTGSWGNNGDDSTNPSDTPTGTINPTAGVFCKDGKGHTVLCDPNATNGMTSNTSTSICPEDDPLTFTPTEQAEIDKLVRQYYLISSGLKADEEVGLVLNDTNEQYTLLAQVNELTADCKAQVANPRYAGPKTRKNNPYYQDPTNTATTYLPGEPVIWQGVASSGGGAGVTFGGFGGLSFNQYNSPFAPSGAPTYSTLELLSNIW